MGKPPTLADVARHAGVSTFTASLALRQSPRVATATRERVLAAAAALDCRPNPLVKTLMANVRMRHRKPSGDVLAFLLSREQAIHPGQLNYQVRLQEGAASRAMEHGFRLEPIRMSSVNGSGRRLQQVLDTRNIVGVIVPPVPSRCFHFGLDWSRLACVSIGHSFAETTAHRVSSNHFRIMRTALESCRRLGWARPGLVLSQRLVHAADDTLIGGYLGATYLTDRSFPIEPLLYADDHLEPQAFLEWVRRNRVGVVLTMRSDLLGILRGAGYTVGQDIGYVLLDCAGETGEFAGIDQRMSDLGGAAVDLLVQVMQGNEFGVPRLPRVVELDSRWIDGPTLPARPDPPKSATPKQKRRRSSR